MRTTMPELTVNEVVPTGEVETYHYEARQAIFNLENVDEALKDAPTQNGRVELSTAEWATLNRLALDARSHAARLRELADSIDDRVRSAGTVDG
jgi:hypothetical protein